MEIKEIEHKAKEIANQWQEPSDYNIARDAATEMAKWALSNQWVRVEDELPKDKQKVFIRLTDGRSTSGWYSHSIEEWFISVGEISGDDCLYERVTHWMPIPPLAEEGVEK